MLRDTPTGQEGKGRISLAQHDNKRLFCHSEEQRDEDVIFVISPTLVFMPGTGISLNFMPRRGRGYAKLSVPERRVDGIELL